MKLQQAGKLERAAGTPERVKCSASELEAENVRLRLDLANAKLDLEIV